MITFPRPTVARTFTLKFQLAFPKKFPAGKNFQSFANRVEELTDGKVKIILFEPGQLVKAKGVFDALRKGTIDLYGGSMLYFAGDVPEVNCEWLPYSWSDSKEVVELYHDYGWLDLMNQAVMKHGIRYVTPIAMASMGLITKFPIHKLEDLKGKKIRAVGMEGMIVDALGGAPVSLPAVEQYLALQRGVVDGTDFAFFTIARWKFYEVCKYISLPAFHAPAVINLLVNKKLYDSLPKDYQMAIDKAGRETLLNGVEQHRKLDEHAYRVCKEHDVNIITLDPKETERFRKATLPLWNKMAQKSEISRKLIKTLKAFMKAKGRSVE